MTKQEEIRLWKCGDRYRSGLVPHPSPERLVKPPYEAWHDDLKFCWFVRSPNRPDNALLYGIEWEEVNGN